MGVGVGPHRPPPCPTLVPSQLVGTSHPRTESKGLRGSREHRSSQRFSVDQAQGNGPNSPQSTPTTETATSRPYGTLRASTTVGTEHHGSTHKPPEPILVTRGTPPQRSHRDRAVTRVSWVVLPQVTSPTICI